MVGSGRFRDVKLGGVGAGRRRLWTQLPHQGWAAPSISELRRQFTEPERVLMLSEGGPMAVEPFSSFPTSRETRFDSQPSNMNRRSRRLWYAQTSRFSSLSEKKDTTIGVVLRRLRQIFPLSARSCRRSRALDPCGHHRAACADAGMLGRRGYALESIMAHSLPRARIGTGGAT